MTRVEVHDDKFGIVTAFEQGPAGAAQRQASSRMFSLFLYAEFSPFFSFDIFMTAGTSFLLFMTVPVRWHLTLLSSLASVGLV